MKCVLAVVECAGVICQCLAKVLEQCAWAMKNYIEDAVPDVVQEIEPQRELLNQGAIAMSQQPRRARLEQMEPQPGVIVCSRNEKHEVEDDANDKKLRWLLGDDFTLWEVTLIQGSNQLGLQQGIKC